MLEQIGRYRVLSELGRGAMGVVYKAQDTTIGRLVAIKTIRLGELAHPDEREQLRNRLFREAQSAGILSHPSIVTIYDIAEEANQAYITMEFVDGQTLEKMLDVGVVEDAKYMVSLATQTALALDYAHGKGIVHRDIKPGNIMVNSEGMVKITDFGIARIASSKFTHTGTVMGTPSYMSPEQVRGAAVDGRSDEFSLAVVLYEMLTGQKPFTGESITTVIFKIVSENPVPPKELNPSVGSKVNAVVMKALAKEPAERFQRCKDFAEALQLAMSQTANLTITVRKIPSLFAATEASDPAVVTQPGKPATRPEDLPTYVELPPEPSRGPAASPVSSVAPPAEPPAIEAPIAEARPAAPEVVAEAPGSHAPAGAARLQEEQPAEPEPVALELSSEKPLAAEEDAAAMAISKAAFLGATLSDATMEATAPAKPVEHESEVEKFEKLPPLEVKTPQSPRAGLPPPPPVEAPAKSRAGLVVALVAVLLIVGGGVFWKMRQRTPSSSDQTSSATSESSATAPPVTAPAPGAPSAPSTTPAKTPPPADAVASSGNTAKPSPLETPKAEAGAAGGAGGTASAGRVINVVTDQPGARVVVDGDDLTACTSPCSIPVKAGKHALLVAKPGFQAERREITMARQPVDLQITLRAIVGTLMLSSVPPGASIKVDGQPVEGETPKALKLPPGSHVIAVSKEGAGVAQQTVEVTDDALHSIRLTLQQP